MAFRVEARGLYSNCFDTPTLILNVRKACELMGIDMLLLDDQHGGEVVALYWRVMAVTVESPGSGVLMAWL
ncbi:hypothetical protein F2Q69_00024347 [Brassica cretica]|uniref:Uncharacterized protein n=1 Tax=Brassica cretica TaxID=69181 RepID=A0A8S9Q957_BRACR|nr:hypothetical protein F2Q69_00024347 [Brassica cretica]